MTLPTPAEDEEFSELFDAVVPRVDLVGKGANGMPFLLAKAAADQDGDADRGILSGGFVRDLITKADAEPAPPARDDITMTGSPAAIAAMIANAPVRKAQPDSLKEASMTATPEAVTKADDVVEDKPDVTQVLADGADAPGSDTDPGSPAWEAVDAATAQKWTAIAVRLKNAIQTLAGREGMEVAADGADTDAMTNSWDLEDAACAVDYAISVLAPYAVGEQNEADTGAEQLDAIGKSLDGFDAAPLAVLEGLAPVMKAGRVLSAGNEAAIRGAVESLQKVLASLPAPVEDAAPVAKEKENAVTDTAPATEPAAAVQAPATEVTKAKGDPMTPVYNESGKLVGMVDSTNLVPIAPAAAPASDEDGAADAEPAADDTPPADTTPAPADAAGTPADAPATAPAVVPDDAVTKSDVAALIKEALDAKDAEVASVIKGLEDQIATLQAPAPSKVLTNGALPPAHHMRGQDAGAPHAVDGVELRKSLNESLDASEQKQIHDQMQALAVAKITELHGR